MQLVSGRIFRIMNQLSITPSLRIMPITDINLN